MVAHQGPKEQPAARAAVGHGACLFACLFWEDLSGGPHYSFFQSAFRNFGTGSQSDDVSANPCVSHRLLQPFRQL